MTAKDKVLSAIFEIIDDLNPQLPEEMQLAKTPDTVLFGSGGKLDSLGLVNLVVAVEQKMQSEFDQPISITDERAMSQKNSPFRTVQTLAEYISTLLEEQ
jgi:acyl carrier protein